MSDPNLEYFPDRSTINLAVRALEVMRFILEERNLEEDEQLRDIWEQLENVQGILGYTRKVQS